MNNELPLYKDLTINKLASVFNNTSASYKYYWFISLIQIHQETNQKNIPIRNILLRMICNAWYPINYYKLNFGFSDKLNRNITALQETLGIPVDISLNELFILLQHETNSDINHLISHFDQHVPYRFLSPWIKGNKSEIIHKSESFENNCLYALKKDHIVINPEWDTYLSTHTKLLLDFAYWNLLQYLQKRNPNTPNIASKLIKPIVRGNLNTQRKFWDIVITELGSFECIYTGKPLNTGQYDIEHFIPWSFVSHDQIWNLIPADGSVNSSKSNKLPSLDKFLDPFSRIQHEAIKIMYSRNKKNKLLEDYLVLGSGIKYIAKEPFHLFKERYINIITPLLQIARNSGFENWEY